MPTLDPPRAGLTNTGQSSAVPTPRPRARVALPLARSVRRRAAPTGSPAEARTIFMYALSIPTAEARTPDPTYRMPAISNSPWIVPSSPNGPCSSGKTTSTVASARGGSPASDTTSSAPRRIAGQRDRLVGRVDLGQCVPQ